MINRTRVVVVVAGLVIDNGLPIIAYRPPSREPPTPRPPSLTLCSVQWRWVGEKWWHFVTTFFVLVVAKALKLSKKLTASNPPSSPSFPRAPNPRPPSLRCDRLAALGGVRWLLRRRQGGILSNPEFRVRL